MARIFITGSSDGIGLLTAKRLVADGHQVVLHARSAQRARDAEAACPGAEAVLVADLSSIEETKALAAAAVNAGPGGFDAVIHNAGVYRGQENTAVAPGSGYPRLFTVNTLAPYILAASMVEPPPKRLVFVASSMHYGGRPRLDTMPRGVTYSDSKLHNVMLAKAFARRYRGRIEASNAADPGWVPTKLGGWSAPESLEEAVATYVTVALGEGEAKGEATGEEEGAEEGAEEGKAVTGKYFANSRLASPLAVADDEAL